MKLYSEVCIEVEREKVGGACFEGLPSDVDGLARLQWADDVSCS